MLVSILGALAPALQAAPLPQAPAAPDPAPASRLFFGDVDGDGLDDALVLGPAGTVTLLWNHGQGRFEDVTFASGLGELPFATCALLADLDGDLDLDLYAGSSEVRLWRNLGNAAFEPVPSGIEHDLVDLSARAVDHDRDGRVDLHLHTEAGDVLYRNTGESRFERVELPGAGHAADATWVPTSVSSRRDVLVPATSAEIPSEILPGSPAERRRQRWQAGQSARLGTTPSATSAAGLPPDSSDLLASCLPGIDDQASNACLKGSSLPTLGQLYPISTDLFVEQGTGDVGLGTTSPTAGLHVVSDDGLVATGTIGAGTIPVQGRGTRMMWYPRKAAFRAGGVDSTEWDQANVGDYSVAMGAGTKATENCSTAIGFVTEASGTISTAMGYATVASGEYSTAMGRGSEASGTSSTAMGWFTVASNYYSTAMGRDTIASGSTSTAMGLATNAGAFGGTALGRYNVGGGNPNVWVATDPLFELGNGTDDSSRANALTVLKNGNVGIGKLAPLTLLDLERTGAGTLLQSTALGATATTAISGASAGTTGVGVYAGATHASGSNYGLYATTNSPNGYAGYFVGRVEASGVVRSTGSSGGLFECLNPQNQSASVHLSWSSDVARVRVGGSGAGSQNGLDIQTNGDASLMRLLHNGNVGIGTTSPGVRLHVEGGSDVTATGGGYAQLGPTSGLNIAFDNNEIMARNNGAAAALSLNVDGGDVYISQSGTGRVGILTNTPASELEVGSASGNADVLLRAGGASEGFNFGVNSSPKLFIARSDGTTFADYLTIDGTNGNVGISDSTPSFKLEVNGDAGKPGGGPWSVASDARLKKDVEDLDGALERLLALRGVTFEYIDPESIGELEGERIGFIAQEVEQVFPDWVGEKDDGMKFVSVSGFEALTVEALRELEAAKDAEIAELRAELERRGRDLDELRSMVERLAAERASATPR